MCLGLCVKKARGLQGLWSNFAKVASGGARFLKDGS